MLPRPPTCPTIVPSNTSTFPRDRATDFDFPARRSAALPTGEPAT